METRRNSLLALVTWILVAGTAGAIGSVASIQAGEFYARLRQPGWAPPASVFGPVWTTLYLMMGVAAWLVWMSPIENVWRNRALMTFVAQLFLNAAWSWLFFRWHRGSMAFVEIVILWAAILTTIGHFAKCSALAALMLIPYLAWVTFAAALTWTLWRGNPGYL